ncbi:aquaporin AQPAn.G-like [Anneissia japonica]|uniref:aquaporin AQPAn.G-like n=1 Tax=Anneissia japonica TaxID=1529436 RepID=UPI00142563C3|nr:aquaporin AQPAn.G-like [Anneissia japonica]
MAGRRRNNRCDTESNSSGKSTKSCSFSVELFRRMIAEYLCTFLFILIAGVATPNGDQSDVDVMKTALTLGMAVVTLIHCFERISGAHMNPAISIGMMTARHVSPLTGVVYIVAQSIGAITGTALLKGCLPDLVQTNTGMNDLDLGIINGFQAFALELIMTFILMFTFFATTEDNNLIGHRPSGAVPVGLAFLLNTLWGFKFTGASMNPVRILGPLVILGNLENIWVYVAGPTCGCLLAAFVYKYIFNASKGQWMTPSTYDDQEEIELEAPASQDA